MPRLMSVQLMPQQGHSRIVDYNGKPCRRQHAGQRGGPGSWRQRHTTALRQALDRPNGCFAKHRGQWCHCNCKISKGKRQKYTLNIVDRTDADAGTYHVQIALWDAPESQWGSDLAKYTGSALWCGSSEFMLTSRMAIWC